MKKIEIIWVVTLIIMIFNIFFSPIVAYASYELEKEETIQNKDEVQDNIQEKSKIIEEEQKEQIEDNIIKEDENKNQEVQDEQIKETEKNEQNNQNEKTNEEKNEKREDRIDGEQEIIEGQPSTDNNLKENEETKSNDDSKQNEEAKSNNSSKQNEEAKSNDNSKQNEEIENNDNLKQNIKSNNTENVTTKFQEKITQTIKNGTYVISSAMSSNYVLDVSDNSWNSGANISIWSRNNGNNQRFRVTYLEAGYYTIENVGSGKYLSGTSTNPKNEDNVMQSTYLVKDNQKWILKEAGNGYYYIISYGSSLYLDIYGAMPKNGANVQLYNQNNGLNQKFKFDEISYSKGKQIISNGTYTISTKMNFNQVLDIYEASYSNNANVEVYTRNNNYNQKYRLEYDGNGYYKIKVEHSKKVLTVRQASINKGTNVEQYEDLGLDAQKWIIKEAENGYYYIISKCNGLYLDLQGGVSNSGTNVEVFTANYKDWQKFKFFSTETKASKVLAEGNYVITSALNTNKIIDIEGNVITNNANVEIWKNNGGNNQKFIITYLSDGFCTIKAFNSNKVLTIENSSAISGANVVQSFYNGYDSQKWSIQYSGNDPKSGYYCIVSKLNGLALDIEGASSRDGANVEVYEPNGGNNQKFKFVPTEFSTTISDGKYAILACSNVNKALDIEWESTENGSNVQLWDSTGGSNQSFYIEYIGEGCYTIQVANSKKMLTVKNSNVIQQEYKNLDTQKWIIQNADNNGKFAIRSKATGDYLDIYNNNMSNGTNIGIYYGNDTDAQKFKLEELLYRGIDVSKYQGNINWGSARSEIDFAMIRIGYRGYGDAGNIAIDTYYKDNIKNALSNNIKCGVYFFSQAINEKEGIAEANWVLENIKGYDIKYPVAIDTEWANGEKSGRADWISKEDRTQAIKGFCKTIKSAGYMPIIYASKDWLNNQLDMNQLSGYDVWLAHYVNGAPDKKSDYSGDYSMWQYTSSGSIPGISGYVDLDICYKKYN